MVSIVIPVYRHKETLHELTCRIHNVMGMHRLNYEIIFVDDACPEGSLDVLRALAQKDPCVSIIALERNVGQHRAVLAGLGYAKGERAVVMDGDLQDQPEVIPMLLERMECGSASAVFAGRQGRYESLPRLVTSFIFKNLLSLLCGVPSDAGLFVAMKREMKDRLAAFEGPRLHVIAMMGLTGLPLASIPVARERRASGRSAYNEWKRLKLGFLAMRQVVSFRLFRGSLNARNRGDKIPVKARIGARFARDEKGQRQNQRVKVL